MVCLTTKSSEHVFYFALFQNNRDKQIVEEML